MCASQYEQMGPRSTAARSLSSPRLQAHLSLHPPRCTAPASFQPQRTCPDLLGHAGLLAALHHSRAGLPAYLPGSRPCQRADNSTAFSMSVDACPSTAPIRPGAQGEGREPTDLAPRLQRLGHEEPKAVEFVVALVCWEGVHAPATTRGLMGALAIEGRVPRALCAWDGNLRRGRGGLVQAQKELVTESRGPKRVAQGGVQEEERPVV